MGHPQCGGTNSTAEEMTKPQLRHQYTHNFKIIHIANDSVYIKEGREKVKKNGLLISSCVAKQ
jgi:hypothetical protein